MRQNHRCNVAVICLALAIGVQAQAPAPTERVSFRDAIARAVEKNPSSAIAAAGILRAEALLTEVRANTRLQINGTVATTTRCSTWGESWRRRWSAESRRLPAWSLRWQWR